MIDTSSSVPTVPAVPITYRKKGWTTPWQFIGLGAILLISIFMNFYQLVRIPS